MAKTSNASDKFIVRLPDGMRDELKAAAVANGRTMNAEIVARLEAFPQIEKLQGELDRCQLRLNDYR